MVRLIMKRQVSHLTPPDSHSCFLALFLGLPPSFLSAYSCCHFLIKKTIYTSTDYSEK